MLPIETCNNEQLGNFYARSKNTLSSTATYATSIFLTTRSYVHPTGAIDFQRPNDTPWSNKLMVPQSSNNVDPAHNNSG